MLSEAVPLSMLLCFYLVLLINGYIRKYSSVLRIHSIYVYMHIHTHLEGKAVMTCNGRL